MSTEEFDRQSQESTQGHEKPDRAENEDAKLLDWLVREGEWMRLKDNAAFLKLSVERRITKARDAVVTRIQQNERAFYDVLADHPRESGQILEKRMNPLRKMKRALGLCLAGDFNQVKDDMREKVATVLGINTQDEPSKPFLKPT